MIKIENFSNEKLALFFGRFDKQKRSKIKYSQFCDAFVPKSQTVLAELTARKPQNL